MDIKEVDKWVKIETLKEMAATDLSGPSFVLKGIDYPLQEGSNYKITVQVVLKDGSSETESYEFVTNEAPFNLNPFEGCSGGPLEGQAIVTEFNIICEGFIDVDQPLTYEFSYHTTTGEVQFQSGLSPNASVRLPLGDPIADYTIPILITVRDSLGATALPNLVIFTVSTAACLA